MLGELLQVCLRGTLGVVILYLLFWCLWLQYHRDAFAFLLKSKDKKWPAREPPEMLMRKGKAVKTEKKTVYFVRHAESTWNVTFNGSKFPPYFIARLIQSVLFELSLIIKGVADSWFYDSPLSNLGLSQAESIRDKLKKDKTSEDVKVLLGESGRSLIVCSNLRRCMSTALVAFWDRIAKTEERVTILAQLQEATINPDGLSITEPFNMPAASWMDLQFKDYTMSKAYNTNFDPSENTGNKAITSNGLVRMEAFNKWAFSDPKATGVDTLIVVGHSLWFLSYFKTFLSSPPPSSLASEARQKKLRNCGVVGFTLEQTTLDDGSVVHKIDPSTLRVVHLGFK